MFFNNLLGLYEEALEIFRGLLSNNQGPLHSLVMCGYCYLNTGYPEEAIDSFKKALLNPEADDDCFNGLYWSYVGLGMLEDAVNIVRDGLSRFPAAGADLYVDLGDGYYRKGWLQEAKDILEKGLKLYPDDEVLKEMLDTLNDEIDNPDAENKPSIEGCIIVLMKERHKSRRKGDQNDG